MKTSGKSLDMDVKSTNMKSIPTHYLVRKLTCSSLLSIPSLAARIMWRLDKEGGVISDLQLTSLDDLEDHISDIPEIDLKELKVDVHNFLDYWPRTSKQHTVDNISHIFGVVCKSLDI